MSGKTITLTPAFISIGLPNQDPVQIDPYDAIDEIRRSQESETRWDDLREYLAEKLGCTPESLSQHQLYEFNNIAINTAESLDEERKKKAGSIAYLQLATQASPTNTENGKKKKKQPGSATSEKSELGSR